MANWRKPLTNLHVILASFFLPVGLMFGITGGLYTVDYRSESKERSREVELTEPLPADLAGLLAVAEKELAADSISTPTGSASARTGRSGQPELLWHGLNREVLMRGTDDPYIATLTVREEGLVRRSLQLHKARGSLLAKVISIAWVVGLVLMFGTGLGIAFGAPTYRRTATIATIAGLLSFIAYICLS